MSSPVPMDVDRGEEQEERFGPAWLQSLLGAKFFDDPCILHLGQTKKECNYYCLDCTGLSICSLCLPDHHGHRIVQIRRSSYHDVIRLADLEQLLDVSLVQTYLINAEKVVFLNKRPRAPKHERCVSAAGQCEDCGRGLLDAAFRFCCLDCKLKRLEYDPSLTFIVDPKRIQEPAGDGPGSDDDSRRPTKFEKTGSQFGRGKRSKEEGSSTQSSAALTTTVNVPINYRRRPRKGVHRIPERAPLS